MPQPRVLVVRAPGTNCDQETVFAFQRAGGVTDTVHINRLLDEPSLLDQCEILCFPGGFSYGDDLSAGRVLAVQLQHHLREALEQFKAQGKLILGICNGFQVLVKTGILLEPQDGALAATLAWNDSGKFEDRWVQLHVSSDQCVFLRDIRHMYLPVAHAEGRFVPSTAEVQQQLDAAGQLVLRYATLDGAQRAHGKYPDNPNGAIDDIAGVCDATGRVFGLMPHPERYLDRTQHPRWTRETLPDDGDGLAVFENAVKFFQ